MPSLSSADLMHCVNEKLTSIWGAFSVFVDQRTDKAKKHNAIMNFIAYTGELSKIFPVIEQILTVEKCSDTAWQFQISIAWCVRDVHSCLSRVKFYVESIPVLRKSEFSELKLQIKKYMEVLRKLDDKLARRNKFSLSDSVTKNAIGKYTFNTPLRIVIADDDTGKHVSCFEIPQVFGFGENEQEALAMMDREILSLYADLCDGTPVSEEYKALKEMLDMVFDNEE